VWVEGGLANHPGLQDIGIGVNDISASGATIGTHSPVVAAKYNTVSAETALEFFGDGVAVAVPTEYIGYAVPALDIPALSEKHVPCIAGRVGVGWLVRFWSC